MVVADLLKISCEMLKLLSKYAVKTEDYKHLDLFADYVRMRDLGEKTSYIVAVLSEKYNLSEATIYRLLRKFRKTVKT